MDNEKVKRLLRRLLEHDPVYLRWLRAWANREDKSQRQGDPIEVFVSELR
jgi:hypothetical protein